MCVSFSDASKIDTVLWSKINDIRAFESGFPTVLFVEDTIIVQLDVLSILPIVDW